MSKVGLFTLLISCLTTAGAAPLAQALPESYSAFATSESGIEVTITADQVLVQGSAVIELVDGQVRAEDVDPDNGEVIPAVWAQIEAVRAADLAGTERVIVVAGPTTPFGTLSRVVASSHVAENVEVGIAVQVGDRAEVMNGSFSPAEGEADRVIPVTPLFGSGLEVADPEHPELPMPLLSVSNDSFFIADLRGTAIFLESGLGYPVAGCDLSGTAPPPTVCSLPGEGVDGADYRQLYNRLVEIKQGPYWSMFWSEDAPPTLVISAGEETELQAVVGMLDVAGHHLESDRYDDDTAFESASVRLYDYYGADGELVDDPIPLFFRLVLAVPDDEHWTLFAGGTSPGSDSPRGFEAETLETTISAPEGTDYDVNLGDLTVNGPLERAIIQRVIRQNRRRIRDCYQREATRNAELCVPELPVEVSFEILSGLCQRLELKFWLADSTYRPQLLPAASD